MTVSEEERCHYEDLDIIVTKDASCNTDASDDFTTDR